MKKPIIVGMVAALALLLLSSCSGSKAEVAPAAPTPPPAAASTPAPTSVGSTPLPDAVTTPSVGILVGNQAPGFQLNDMNGKTVSLSDFRGKVVLINFWATW